MSLGLIGKKVGMTTIYTPKGRAIGVTVIDVSGNQVLQVKKASEKDGYDAVQLGFDDQKDFRINKPEAGHFKRWGGTSKKKVQEFRLAAGEEVPASGTVLSAEHFVVDQWIDVIGTTKGKGFQGVMKRHNFAGQPATHGHMMHRRPGSIGCRLTPGLVWKNQKMPGHDGVNRRTTQNLQIVAVRPADGVILVSGAVPGAKGSYLTIRPAKKKPAPAKA
jgi:large subunit ribosomal protein L3